MKIFNFLALFTFVVFFTFNISAQESAPTEQQTAEQQTVETSPETSPAEQPAPAEQQPAETSPETAPAEQPATTEQAPAEQPAPAEQQPAETSSEAAQAEQAPVTEQQPVETSPETAPAEQPAPAEQQPAETSPEAAPAEQQQEQQTAEQQQSEDKPVAAEEKKEEKKTADSKSGKDKEKDENDKKIRDIEKRFWKGEVANIGANEIISPYNSAGLAAGVKFMDDALYLVIDPKFSMHFDQIITEPVSDKKLDLIFAIHAPFNIRLVSTDVNSNDGKIRFRKEDWDEWQDYLKILRYFQIGTSEDNLYFSLGSNFAQTIGHGTILKRYVPNHDSTFSTMSAKLNWYFDYAGFEALLGDVARGNIFGGLVFIKPFSAIGNYHARSVSFGYSFVADRNAPTKLKYENYLDYNADDYINGLDDREPRIAVDSHGRPIVLDDEFLYMQGIDFELKLYKN